MDEIIKRHRAMVAERLTQGFSPVHRDAISKAQEGFDDIEKARVVRQDGDIHPNGKWVWSSQAAGGKGDWRVIKKPKDGSPAPAPAKKETKSADVTKESGEKMSQAIGSVLSQGIKANKEAKSDKASAPALSSEALMKTLENMSAEDLIKLQSMIKDVAAKRASNKMKGDKEQSPIEYTSQETLKGYQVSVLDRAGAAKQLDISAEWVREYKDVPNLRVLRLNHEDMKKWQKDLAFDFGPLGVRDFGAFMVEKDVDYHLFNDKSDAFASATAIADAGGDFAAGVGAFNDYHSTIPHISYYKLNDNDKLMRDIKGVVWDSDLVSSASRKRAVKALKSVKDRFGDRVEFELSHGLKEPSAVVSFDHGLKLTVSFGKRKDDVYTRWSADKSTYVEQVFGDEKFDVYKNISWPRGYIRNEIEDTEAALRHIKEGRHDLVDPSYEFKFKNYLSRLKDIEKMMRGSL